MNGRIESFAVDELLEFLIGSAKSGVLEVFIDAPVTNGGGDAISEVVTTSGVEVLNEPTVRSLGSTSKLWLNRGSLIGWHSEVYEDFNEFIMSLFDVDHGRFEFEQSEPVDNPAQSVDIRGHLEFWRQNRVHEEDLDGTLAFLSIAGSHDFELSPLEWNTICLLLASGHDTEVNRIRIGEIASQLEVEPSTVEMALRRLIEGGLLSISSSDGEGNQAVEHSMFSPAAINLAFELRKFQFTGPVPPPGPPTFRQSQLSEAAPDNIHQPIQLSDAGEEDIHQDSGAELSDSSSNLQGAEDKDLLKWFLRSS